MHVHHTLNTLGFLHDISVEVPLHDLLHETNSHHGTRRQCTGGKGAITHLANGIQTSQDGDAVQ